MVDSESSQPAAPSPKVTLAPSQLDVEANSRRVLPIVTLPPVTVPTERLRNGGGIADISCHVAADSFVDQHSSILQQSAIINSSLIHSKAQSSFLYNSSLNNSQSKDSCVLNSKLEASRLLNSKAANSRVLGSLLRVSVAAGALISNSTLENVIIAGLFGQSPEIHGVKLADCTIEGEAKLIGPWELCGPARIHEGEWYRAPRWKRISSKETEHYAVLTECVNGRALIACRCHEMRRWQRSGPRLGRFLGWPAAMVQEAWLTFEEWLDTSLTDGVGCTQHST